MFLASSLMAGILYGGKLANAFYLPGIAPQSFSAGDEVKLKVNKVTSSKTLYPLDYYHFPFCEPEGGPVKEHENLGELLIGDRIESSPYVLKMKEEMYCRMVCVTDLGDPVTDRKQKVDVWKNMSKEQRVELVEARKRGEHVHPKTNLVAGAIRRQYSNNWIVDNLSAASKSEDSDSITLRYSRGFPIGYIGEDNRAYVNNHVNIELMYHPVESETNKYRVVRFTVEPFSILHSFEETPVTDEDLYRIINPIDSCKKGSSVHTDWDMVESGLPQQASGEVLFTYDVTWIENKDLKWASRWDVYLTMDNAIPSNLHWQSVVNSLVIVILLTTFIAGILVRNLRRDIAGYNQVLTDEEKADELEEQGWKLVHADVFRPPSFSPLLLSVASGTGLQLLFMAAITITLSALGFVNPSFRGALLMALIMLYALMGVVSGYTTARMYKTFKGKRWQFATTLAATAYPGLFFAVFFLLNLVAVYHNSTDAVPFTTMLVLLILWFGMSSPLVFLGAYFGYKKDGIEFPTRASNIPRKIPEQVWWMHPLFSALVFSILPFTSSYLEMYFIMNSMWMGQYYYVFGVLFCVFIILIVSCAEIAIVMTYLQLCAEDYNWWWRSFCTGGSVALFFFCQAVLYFSSLETNSLATYMLYFGYMGLVCLGIFLMTGSVGMLSTLWFNRTIYGAIKVD